VPYLIDQPFPTPTNQPLETQIGVLAMKEYLRAFEQRRNERPDRQFANADITELMRRTENLDKAAAIEMKFISSELLRKRPELFRHEPQKARFRNFLNNHKSRNATPSRLTP
jgi:hypothetical protein